MASSGRITWAVGSEEQSDFHCVFFIYFFFFLFALFNLFAFLKKILFAFLKKILYLL